MGNLEIVAASWESITKLVSFSVFSCRTIINSSPRRRERMRYSRGGCRAPVSKPPPPFFSPLGPRRTDGQSMLITALVRGGLQWSPQHHHGRWWMATPAARMSFANRNRSAQASRAGSSSSLTAAAQNPPPPLTSHHHCFGSCLESCAALPPALAAAQS